MLGAAPDRPHCGEPIGRYHPQRRQFAKSLLHLRRQQACYRQQIVKEQGAVSHECFIDLLRIPPCEANGDFTLRRQQPT